jgi:hypothetical protein
MNVTSITCFNLIRTQPGRNFYIIPALNIFLVHCYKTNLKIVPIIVEILLISVKTFRFSNGYNMLIINQCNKMLKYNNTVTISCLNIFKCTLSRKTYWKWNSTNILYEDFGSHHKLKTESSYFLMMMSWSVSLFADYAPSKVLQA